MANNELAQRCLIILWRIVRYELYDVHAIEIYRKEHMPRPFQSMNKVLALSLT